MKDYFSEALPQNDAFDAAGMFDGDDSFASDDSFGLTPSSECSARFGRWTVAVVACGVLAVAGACVALILAAQLDASGLAVAAVGGAAYSSAVVSDLFYRRLRLIQHSVASRPWLTAGLRIAVFAAAVLAVWIASKGTSAP